MLQGAVRSVAVRQQNVYVGVASVVEPIPRKHETYRYRYSEKGSKVRLKVDPGAVVSDRGGGRAGIEEQPRRQELRRGGQIGGDLLLEHRARDLVDDAHPNRASVRRRCDEQGQNATRSDDEGPANVG